MNTAEQAVEAAAELRDAVEKLRFAEPVACVYNPLVYAWAPHECYLRRWATGPRRVLFMGMNPGPWGMAQTGVPFGEIALVRDWIGVEAPVALPATPHPKRPVEGFACKRSEVSGRRLWGLFRERFGAAEAFFAEHFVANYCPLVFMEDSARNRTPDKLPAAECAALYAPCDAHVRALARILECEHAVGIGAFAEERLRVALEGMPVTISRVLHPSPASPAANRDWAGLATRQLQDAGVWERTE